jgi:hypothetical protein
MVHVVLELCSSLPVVRSGQFAALHGISDAINGRIVLDEELPKCIEGSRIILNLRVAFSKYSSTIMLALSCSRPGYLGWLSREIMLAAPKKSGSQDGGCDQDFYQSEAFLSCSV